MSSKSIAKRRNPILSKLSAQQSLLTSYPHSAPISLQSSGDGSRFSNQKSWSKELIAAATTLQSIAMSSTRVRTENPYDDNTIHNTELSNLSATQLFIIISCFKNFIHSKLVIQLSAAKQWCMIYFSRDNKLQRSYFLQCYASNSAYKWNLILRRQVILIDDDDSEIIIDAQNVYFL